MLATLLSLALVAVPAEYHIDCSGWTGNARVEIGVRVVALDGTTYKTEIGLLPGSEPEVFRAMLWFDLRDSGWRGRPVQTDILILEGSKAAPVWSIEFTSVVWKPDVRWVPITPKK